MPKKYLSLEDVRCYYDEKHDNFRMITKDERFKGLPFQLTITKDSETERTLRKVMIEEELAQQEFVLPQSKVVSKNIFKVSENDAGKLVIGSDRTGNVFSLNMQNAPGFILSEMKNSESLSLFYKNILHNIEMNPDLYEAKILPMNLLDRNKYEEFKNLENVTMLEYGNDHVSAVDFIDFLYEEVEAEIKNKNRVKKTIFIIDRLPNEIFQNELIMSILNRIIRVSRSCNILILAGVPISYSYSAYPDDISLATLANFNNQNCYHEKNMSSCINCKISEMGLTEGQGIIRTGGSYDTPVSLFITHNITTTPENFAERLRKISQESFDSDEELSQKELETEMIKFIKDNDFTVREVADSFGVYYGIDSAYVSELLLKLLQNNKIMIADDYILEAL